MKVLCIFLFRLAFLPACIFGQMKTFAPIKTTLCELAKNPGRFSGQLVEVLGQAGPIERTLQDTEQEIMALPLHHPAIDPALLIPPVLPWEQNVPDKPIKTSVCELLENPQRFLDRLFEIRAELVGESTLLRDPNCSGTVPLLLPEERSATKGKDYYRLKRYLNHPGVAIATIVGTCAMRGNPHGGTFMCEAQSVSDVRSVKSAK